MSVDAGSISSSVRIKLDQLNADINACKTAFDQLGGNLAASAANYANITGKQYVSALKKIQSETDNITAAAKAGAISQQQATAKLIQLRQQELTILQKRAISEAGSNKATIAAIKNTEAGLKSLIEKQKLLGDQTESTSMVGQKMESMFSVAGIIGGLTALAAGLKKTENEFAKAEVGWQRLDLALKLNGMEGAKKGLTDLANDLQKLTGEDADYVAQLEAELVAQGRSEKQINDLIKASAGLSAITGDDLSASLEQLNKTYEGVAPRSSALKALTDGLTEAQLRNGEGIRLVKEKYEGYIGTVGTTEIANKRLKESFGDFAEGIGRGVAGVTFGAKGTLADVFEELARLMNAQAEASEAMKARKKGVATLDQQILALETTMLENGNKKLDQEGKSLQSYYIEKDQVEQLKKQLEDLNKKTTKNTTEQTKLLEDKRKVNLAIAGGEKHLQDILNSSINDKRNKQYIEEYNAKLALRKAQEEEEQARKRAVTGKTEETQTNKALIESQKAYNDAIALSLMNQRDIGDAKGGLSERINLTKEYIKTLNAQGASTVVAQKALADYEYQLGTLTNIEKIAALEKEIAKLGLSTEELKAKQREQAIADIRNGEGSKESKEKLIALLEQQSEAQDALAESDANKKLAASTQDYQDKLDALNGVVKDQIEVERTRALELIDKSGASDEAIEQSKKVVNEYFDALKESKGPEEFAKNLKKVSDVVGDVAGFVKDVLSSVDDAVQATYDKMITAAEEAAEAQEKTQEAQHEAETAALDEEYQHKLELLEYDGFTQEEFLKKKVADAIAAGDAEAQADAEKELLKFQTQEEYAAKQTALKDQQALDDEAREKQAAYIKADLEYRAALASWNIKMAIAISDGIAAVINAIATTPGDAIIKGISGAATGVLVGLKIGALTQTKPTPPKLATGGIILPQSGGVPTVQAENGYAELSLNGGPSGMALLDTFASRVALAIMKHGGNSQAIQIENKTVLDGKIVAESTARYINNGQVALK